MSLQKPITMLPLMGPWHLRHPRWNVITLRDTLEVLDPELLLSTALNPAFASDPNWLASDELALPWSVAPWARQRGLELIGLRSAGGEEGVAFDELMNGVPQGRSALQAARQALQPLHELLPQALDLQRIVAEVLPPLEAAYRTRIEAFGEGPGTGWRGRRAQQAAAAIKGELAAAADRKRVALLVEVDLWAAMVSALSQAEIAWNLPEAAPVSAAARERSLLDLAWRGEAADVAGLLGQLRELGHPEAKYLAANLLLAHQHPAEALQLLEEAANSDFREPYLLPGMLLARLGQLRDLAGQRQRALQAYRGALALSWISSEAREAAEAGLIRAFELPGGSGA
jgi:hypothetical protein